MPVSPQDFELYSRMTGAPMPSDAMSRMQMAPEVYEFTKNFARRPNLLEKTGNLVKNIGKGAVMAIGAPMIAESLAEQARIDEKLRNEKDKIKAEAATTSDPVQASEELQIEQEKTKRKSIDIEGRKDLIRMANSGVQQTNLNPVQMDDYQALLNPTTADTYGQDYTSNQTSSNIVDRKISQASQIADSTPNVAEVLSESQDSRPAALYGSGNASEQRKELLKRDKLDKALKGVLGENIQQGNSSDEYIPVRRDAINTGATVNLNPRRQEIENTVRKNLATLTPDQQAKVVDKIISDGNIQQGNSSDEYIPVRLDTNIIMNTKKTSPVKSITPNFDMSKNSTPTATFEMKQKGGSTKPYTFGVSTPMAVSLNEMIMDGSIKNESFGELANLLRNSIKEDIGVAFNPYDQ